MTLDLTKLPAKVTIVNKNKAPEKVTCENKFEGQERIALYRVNQFIDLKAGDTLLLTVTESEQLAHYLAQAKDGAIRVKYEEIV